MDSPATLFPAATERAPVANKIGRNAACPCGSGKKYKHCCLDERAPPQVPGFAKPVHPFPLAPRAGRGARKTLRGASFTPAAAEAISRGELQDLGLHPWIVAQLRERTGSGPGGQPPVWTIARVRAMETTALQATLARLGVQVDQVSLSEAAREEFSAWDLSLDWAHTGLDAEFLGLVACELWRRWVPQLASLEMIDEVMQDGYDSLEAGDARAACATWLDTWMLLLDALPEEGSINALDAAFGPGLNTVGNWAGDVATELRGLVRSERALGRWARAVYCAVAEHLDDRRIRRDLADLHYSLGETAEGERVLTAILHEDPDDADAYALLADALSDDAVGAYADVPRAIALLEEALARPVRNATSWGLVQRLKDLRGRGRVT